MACLAHDVFSRSRRNAWRDDISDWMSQAHRYAYAVTAAAADNYSENEKAAEEDFHTFINDGRRV